MTIEKALELVKINASEITPDKKKGCEDCVLFGTYKNEQISVYESRGNFVIELGIGQKMYRVYKDSGQVEDFEIIVA